MVTAGLAELPEPETPPEPEVNPILEQFSYSSLPSELHLGAALFYDLAEGMLDWIPNKPKKSIAITKLLEARDAFVRAALD